MAGRRVHLVRRDLIFAAVREAGRISRADLASDTGMARMTVTGLVAELLDAGLLAEADAAPDGSRPGRPARLLTLGEGAGAAGSAPWSAATAPGSRSPIWPARSSTSGTSRKATPTASPTC